MVNDHRSEYKVNDAEAVLNGELDDIIKHVLLFSQKSSV
jgi:protein subunit release factor A